MMKNNKTSWPYYELHQLTLLWLRMKRLNERMNQMSETNDNVTAEAEAEAEAEPTR